MLKIYAVGEAKKTILRRVPLDDLAASPRLLDSIRELFGEPLSPDQAVRRILKEIRSEGDSALRRWSAKLDGLDSTAFRIPLAEIGKAKNGISAEQLPALKISAEKPRWSITNNTGPSRRALTLACGMPIPACSSGKAKIHGPPCGDSSTMSSSTRPEDSMATCTARNLCMYN